ncbi:hypothetical protein [Desulfonatronospira sp.]|uniref:hypothetical protein n=1 Tax=Desulfonatronospira sp. TaxID=1962951 RepID=UPI0025BCED0F|nr:hypothetical protein [Desulfonatronospira sp.]
MEAWVLLVYMMIFLVFVVGAALIYARMIEWKKNNIKQLEQRLAEVEQHYDQLSKEVGDFKLKNSKLKAELQDLKKTRAMMHQSGENGEDQQEEADEKVTDAVSVLYKMGLIDKKQIEKARHYIEKADKSGLSVEDAVVLLGFIQPEELSKAKKKVQQK